MAGVPDEELIKLGPWPGGLNNLSREAETPADQLRGAVNLDLPRDGHPQTRAGYSLSITTTRAHSLWHDGLFPFALYVDSGALKAFQPGDNPFTVQAGLASTRDASYALVTDRVYWSNGHDTGVVLSTGMPAPWGVETPAGQPTLTSTTAGALYPGNYQVTITYLSATGEESGTGPAALVSLPTGGGIGLSAIPQPVGTAVALIRVYLSGANGDGLYWSRDMPVGMTSTTLTFSAEGKRLQTQFLDPMPAGQIVTLLNGRLYVAVNNMLYWSEALRYGLTRLAMNRIRFPAALTLLTAVGEGTEGAGLYVATANAPPSSQGRTYFLAGPDPAQFAQRIVYGYGVIPGTSIRAAGSLFGLESAVPVAYWIAANGIACLGLPEGQVTPIREKQVVAPAADKGASLLREANGIRQIVTALDGSISRNLAVSDAAAATVYRNGVVLP